jgi:hypothetical protein
MARRRRWPFVVLGIAIVLVFVGIGAVIATVAWFQENMEVASSTARDAEAEFETVRQKFAGREPLLELHDGMPRFTKARGSTASASGSLATLNVMVWDPDEEKIFRIGLPFWLLRLKADPIRFSAYASGFDDEAVALRPEDIEKYGAGIILDGTSREGERILLWAQ